MTPPKREYWDRVAEDWTLNQQQALWRRHSDTINSELLRRWLPSQPVARLLKTDLFDEAVSTGLCPILDDCAGQLVGVDVSQGIVEAAMRRFPNMETHVADVRQLPFDDSTFDVIVSISTLDHFESQHEIQKALIELSRLLRPGGRLLLTLDNLSNPVVWLRSILPERLLLGLGLVPYRVGATCSPARLQTYCSNARLELLDKTAIMHCPRVLAVAGANLINSHASRQTQERYLKVLKSFEKLESWPSRFITGHFTAIHARKPLQEESRG